MNQKYKINSSILTTEVDDELGMMSIEKGSYYTLNPVGKEVWKLLANAVSLEEIVGELMKDYSVSREECYNDISSLLEDFKKNGLVDIV